MISGKRHHHVEDGLQVEVETAAEIGAADAEHQPAEAGDDGAGKADDQRGARAEDDARQEVAPELVGAEPMRPARRLGHRREVVGGRAVGRDPLGEDARQPP